MIPFFHLVSSIGLIGCCLGFAYLSGITSHYQDPTLSVVLAILAAATGVLGAVTFHDWFKS